jgi:hypothetical protein
LTLLLPNGLGKQPRTNGAPDPVNRINI